MGLYVLTRDMCDGGEAKFWATLPSAHVASTFSPFEKNMLVRSHMQLPSISKDSETYGRHVQKILGFNILRRCISFLHQALCKSNASGLELNSRVTYR
jgi:hypothetical protein